MQTPSCKHYTDCCVSTTQIFMMPVSLLSLRTFPLRLLDENAMEWRKGPKVCLLVTVALLPVLGINYLLL